MYCYFQYIFEQLWINLHLFKTLNCKLFVYIKSILSLSSHILGFFFFLSIVFFSFSEMALSSSALNENLQCFICLELSTDPVTTPCGHSFCKACLKECWESSHDNRCPCCKENFNNRADLRDFEQQSEILMCQSFYCEPKVETHGRVLKIKQVVMIDLVVNINPKIIQKHDRPLELFCRDDHTSACLSCNDEDHKTHNTVPVEDKREKKKVMKSYLLFRSTAKANYKS